MNPLLRSIFTPLARLYGSRVAKRNASFDLGRAVVHFDRPVISVGNLSVGGTGKTPMVRHVVRLLREQGKTPCIAMRGYGSTRRADGRSDEADEYTATLGAVPIVAQPNRSDGLVALFGTPEGEAVDTIVLDDGFQHRRIARQLDIVLLDATRSPLHDHLLPLGRLREPMASLARAHAVVVTHAERAEPGVADAILAAALRINPSLTTAIAEHAWASLRVGESDQPVLWLHGKTVLPVCAIGNPKPFIAAAESHAATVLPPIVLRDHDPYAPASVRRIAAAARGADAILTTGKDWAKLGTEDRSTWPCPVAVPSLEMRFRTGGDALDRRITEAASAGTDTLGS